MMKLVRRMLKVGYYAVLALLVGTPIVLDYSRRQFVMEQAELKGMQWVDVVRVGDMGWTDVVSGSIKPEHLAEFIRVNDLRPEGPSDQWWIRRDHGYFADWEKHWPVSGRYYGRVKPRSNATCLYGCSVYCLVDSLSGRVWIAVEMPDFAGG